MTESARESEKKLSQETIENKIRARIPRFTRGRPNEGWEVTPKNLETIAALHEERMMWELRHVDAKWGPRRQLFERTYDVREADDFYDAHFNLNKDKKIKNNGFIEEKILLCRIVNEMAKLRRNADELTIGDLKCLSLDEVSVVNVNGKDASDITEKVRDLVVDIIPQHKHGHLDESFDSKRIENMLERKFVKRNSEKRNIALIETYKISKKLPRWFRVLFKKGPQIFDLIPTFVNNISNACTEYRDLCQAHLTITVTPQVLSPSSRPDECKLFVKEELHFPSCSFLVGDGAHWRKTFSYEVTGSGLFSRRRVTFNGSTGETVMPHVPHTEETTSSNIEKMFELTFIQDTKTSGDFIRGTYRRQMSTVKRCLTWKFICTRD